MNSGKSPLPADQPAGNRNLRTALILVSVVVVFFLGVIAKHALLG